MNQQYKCTDTYKLRLFVITRLSENSTYLLKSMMSQRTQITSGKCYFTTNYYKLGWKSQKVIFLVVKNGHLSV